MTIRRYLAALIAAAILAVLCLAGCTTETVTTRTTSAKGHVVETVVITKKADPAALSLAGTVASLYAPPRIVRQEKSSPKMGELLPEFAAGTDRITREEIERRRK
jgi:hypothetical protein